LAAARSSRPGSALSKAKAGVVASGTASSAAVMARREKDSSCMVGALAVRMVSSSSDPKSSGRQPAREYHSSSASPTLWTCLLMVTHSVSSAQPTQNMRNASSQMFIREAAPAAAARAAGPQCFSGAPAWPQQRQPARPPATRDASEPNVPPGRRRCTR
jgi:hypothetical protein